jgi:hypothetical protein
MVFGCNARSKFPQVNGLASVLIWLQHLIQVPPSERLSLRFNLGHLIQGQYLNFFSILQIIFF